MNSKRIIPFLLLILSMLFWAANFHAVKIALEFYSPMSVATLRFLFGVIALFVLLYIQLKGAILKIRFTHKEWWYLFLTGFFGIFLAIYFFNIGLKTTSAVNGSLITATTPAITGILTFFFLNQKLTIKQWFAIALSFLGVLIILVKGDVSKLMQLQFETGDVYILLMVTVFSLSQIIVSKYLSHIDSIQLTAVSSLMALVLFACFSIPELTTVKLTSDVSFWGSILFMGVLGTAIAYTAFYYCVVKLGPTISTLSMNLIPFFAVLLAFPFGEKLHSVQIIGGVIIIIGLIIFGRYK